jgi:hypothetical protein
VTCSKGFRCGVTINKTAAKEMEALDEEMDAKLFCKVDALTF